MKKNNLTYEKSGVNIKAADNFVKFISSISKKRENSKNFQNIGGFGSITSISKKKNRRRQKKIADAYFFLKNCFFLKIWPSKSGYRQLRRQNSLP